MSDSNNSGSTLVMLAGAGLAGWLSYAKFGSVVGATVKALFLGWFYVIYYVIRYGVK